MKTTIKLLLLLVFIYGIFLVFKEKKVEAEVNLPAATDVNYVTEKPTFDPKIQIIKGSIVDEVGLVPQNYTVKVGQPVRFEINSNVDVEGCMSTIVIYGLYDKPSLIKAEKTIVMEFTPKQTGIYDISCAMGVPWGELQVVN